MVRAAAAALAVGMCVVSGGQAKVVNQTVEYQAGEVTCKGYLAYDDAVEGKRPGVLVIHDYWGLNDFAKGRADTLAAMGYVAFAADMYGGGKVAATGAEAGQLAGGVRGGPLMRIRANAAYDQLRANPMAEPARLAAIGYCFGGTGVLELAYSGAELAGVVSFHGGLTAPGADDMKRIKAKILICHGAADPHVSAAALQACTDGLNQAGVDWQLIEYSGAVHAFTNPAAGDDPARGAAYHADAARRSWQHMQLFLHEIFGTEGQ